MPPRPRPVRPSPTPSRLGARSWKRLLILGVAALLPLACGGESGSSSEADAGDPAAGNTAGAPAASPAGEAGTRSSEDGIEHTHGGDTHTHAAADTLDAAVPLAPSREGSSPGSVTVLARGDTVRLHVALEDAGSETRYSAELLAGSCSEPGDVLADLTPLMTGTAGRGSSQTTVAPGRTAGHTHGAVRVNRASGPAVGCAEVHLGGDHTHEGG